MFWHGWCSECDIGEAWYHILQYVSSIKAVSEGGKMTLQVSGIKLVKRSPERSFEVSEHGVDPSERGGVFRYFWVSNDFRLVDTSCLRQGSEAG